MPRAFLRFVSDLELRLRKGRHSHRHMSRIDLIPEATADGTIVLRPVDNGLLERLRRLVRRLIAQ